MQSIGKIILATIAIASFYALALAIQKGIEGTERAECIKWQEEAETYKSAGYYLTAWQTAQCEARGIQINAITK